MTTTDTQAQALKGSADIIRAALNGSKERAALNAVWREYLCRYRLFLKKPLFDRFLDRWQQEDHETRRLFLDALKEDFPKVTCDLYDRWLDEYNDCTDEQKQAFCDAVEKHGMRD